MFTEGTGHKLFASPHRDSDRVAFELAKEWTLVSPNYAAGLLAAKADRLLTNERPLLYWPLYRQSVLPEGSRVLTWFTTHRTGVERVVDWFWYVLVASSLVGVVAAFARRNRVATSLLPMPLALAALYTLFFAEARYHLAIVILMLPFAGAGLVWVGEAVRDLARFTIDRQRRPRLPIEGVVAAVIIALLFVGWPRMLAAGARLRDAAPLGGRGVHGRRQRRACARSGRRCRRRGRATHRSVACGTASGFAWRSPPSPPRPTSTCPPASIPCRCALEAPVSSPEGAEVALIVGGTEVRRTPWPAIGLTNRAGGRRHACWR